MPRQESLYLEGLGHGAAPIPLACKVGPIVMTSGIVGRDRMTGNLPSSAEEQAQHCFENLASVLAQVDLDLGDVVRISVAVKTEADREAINGPWLEAYPDPAHRPARHVAVTHIRGAALVQIEAMAVARVLSG